MYTGNGFFRLKLSNFELMYTGSAAVVGIQRNSLDRLWKVTRESRYIGHLVMGDACHTNAQHLYFS